MNPGGLYFELSIHTTGETKMVSDRYLCQLVLAFNARSLDSRAFWLHQEHKGNFEHKWQLHKSNDHEDPTECTLNPDPLLESDEPCNHDKNEYLIRLVQLSGLSEDGDVWNWPLVMGDLGTTYEPWNASATERNGKITGDLEADLKLLESLVLWKDGRSPYDD